MRALMRNSRRWTSLFVSALLLSTPVQAAKVKLRVATHINDPELVEKQKAIMRGFETAHPDVEIEVIYTPWNEYHDRILTMFLGGVGPDVVSIGRFQFASFIESGLIQPLDSFIRADRSLDLKRDVVGPLMASGYYKGKIYGFPIYNGPALLFYNPSLFERWGVAEPPTYVRENRWNRDTFVEVAKKLTYDANGDGKPEIFGYSGFSTWEPSWVPFLRGAGGDVIGPDGASALNSAPVKETFQWLVDLRDKLGVVGGDWAGGTQAMAIRWQTNGLIERNLFKNFSPEPALIPAGPAGYAHVAGGVPVAVSATTKHPQLAYEFAKWFALESGIWHLRGGPPLSWKHLRGRDFRNTLAVFRNADMFEMALSLGDTRPEPQFGIVNYQEMNNILANVLIAPILQGKSPVNAAVEEAHRLLNGLLTKEQPLH